MKSWGRLAAIGSVVSAVLVFAVPAWSQTPPNLMEPVAKAYGLDSFGQIEVLRYTFNAELPGINLSRSWVWQPKTGEISYEGKDKDGKPVKANYRESQVSGQPADVKDVIEPAFINDQYHLLFPIRVFWDGGAALRDDGTQKLPIGTGSARGVVVDYSPGDVWEIFLGPDNRIRQFTFHRGGPRKPGVVIATWDGYAKAGPLLLATDRRGTADGAPLRIWFTDVAVKLQGSDNWVKAQ